MKAITDLFNPKPKKPTETTTTNPKNAQDKTSSRKMLDFSDDAQLRHKAIIYGLCIGDSLGATTEFHRTSEVGKIMAKYEPGNWPLEYVGGGPWEAGEPTGKY